MTRLSRNQKRRKKLAERELRRTGRNTAPAQQVLREVRHQALATTLSNLAPGEIIWQDDNYDQLILEHGNRMGPSSIQLTHGRKGLCHENCAALFWVHYPAYQIATGYVYQSGVWGRHSWLMDGEAILETTTQRDIYFGVILEEIQLMNFFANQLLSILETCGFRVETAQESPCLTLTLRPGFAP